MRDAIEVVTMSVARCSPEAKGTVHVHPGTRSVGQAASRPKSVKRAGVQVTGLQTDDRRTTCRSAQGSGQGVQPYSATVVAWQNFHCIGAKAEQPHRAKDGLVPVLAHQQPQRRRTGHTRLFRIDATHAQELMPRRREGGGMGHLAAGNEGKGRGPGQAKQLL